MESTLTVGLVTLDLPDGPLHLEALDDRTLRLHRRAPGDASSYALDPDAVWRGPSRWDLIETADGWRVETSDLTVLLSSAGALTVTETAGGTVLVDAEAPGPATHAVRLAPGDRLMGLGDKALSLDRRGHRVEMWNTDAFKYGRGTDPLYKSVPFVLKQGAAAVGLFYDDSHRATFDLGAETPDRLAYAVDRGVLDLYVLAAESPLGVVQAFARLTGRTPMLPRWALGYHQCRYSYMDEAEIREVAREFRQRDIPCDALYFDIHYMDGFRVFTWDRERFPDPPGLLADLRADGFRSVVIVDPGVKADDPDYEVYRQGTEIDAYVRYPDGEEVRGEVWPGTCAFPDYTSPAVRDWWGGLHAGLVADGVDGIWNDMNEPALFSVAHVEGTMAGEENVGTIPDAARHDLDGRGGDHAEAHNVYGMQMQRATYDGLRAIAPDVRPFTITRAAYAGAQRFGTGWTGDNSASWDHLTLAVQTCLSLGTSGMPFVGADVGGFVGTPSGELVARWTQVGALTPLFRNHSAIDTPRQEPWLFGEEVERVCRQAIQLRYRLLPSFYTALWQAATDGLPILRALPLVHPHDETIRRTSPLAFYVGDDLLAHPVLEEGQTEREIYLPDHPGGWYDLLTGEWLDGRQTVWTQTPLDRLPLYARAGSVVALAPPASHTGLPVERLELHLFPAPGAHGSWLYDDAGDGYGPGWQCRLALTSDATHLRLAPAEHGEWQPRWTGWDLVVHGLDGPPQTTRVDGAPAEAAWDGRALRLAVPVGASVDIRR